MSPKEAAVRVLIGSLVHGEYLAVERITKGRRLDETAIAKAIEEYGRVLADPPLEWWSTVDIFPITGDDKAFGATVPM